MFVGREEETMLIRKLMESNNSELVLVYGRRRVGKTYFINYALNSKDFYFTGTIDATTKKHLELFSKRLMEQFKVKQVPKISNWYEAFDVLANLLDKKKANERKYIFIDEMPWLDTKRSQFFSAFSVFWNSYCVNNNVFMVVCGSAASWMINNLLKNKGSMHNRVTQRIHLEPFNLYETEQFIKKSKMSFTRYDIVQFYMVMGGIPFYLNNIKSEESAIENIDRMCFSNNGILKNEFELLFASLFKNYRLHETIILALAKKWTGVTRKDLIESIKLTDGGAITRALQELLAASFISSQSPIDKLKKETIYRISDNYSTFYLHFISKINALGKGLFLKLFNTTKFNSWSGYAFENICFQHKIQIQNALGIKDLYTVFGSYYKKGSINSDGIQIDLVINRSDNIILLAEIKFHNSFYTISKAYAEKLRKKLHIFINETGTKKNVFFIFISMHGLQKNAHSNNLIYKSLDINDIFTSTM